MAKIEKPKCPKCGSTEVTTALDKSNKHYCQKCQHVWVPGLEGLKREDVALAHYKKENMELKAEIEVVRKDKLALEGQVADLQAQIKKLTGETPAAEDEIFS